MKKPKNKYRLAVFDSQSPFHILGQQMKEVMKEHGKNFSPVRRYSGLTIYQAELDQETLTYITLKFPELNHGVLFKYKLLA